MKQVTIRHTDSYELISYGNGLSYALNKLAAKRGVFFQGGDALQFEAKLEQWEKYHPFKPIGEILAALFSEYETVSEAL